MDKQQEYVLRAIEERDAHPPVVHWTSSGRPSPCWPSHRPRSRAPRGGHRLRRIEASRTHARLRIPTCSWPLTLHIPDAAVAGRDNGDGVACMFCDVLTPDGEPARTDPRSVLERRPSPSRLHLLHPPGDRVLPGQPRRRRRPAPLTTPADHVPGGTRRRLPPPGHPHARADGIWCSSPTRWRARMIDLRLPTPCPWRTTSRPSAPSSRWYSRAAWRPSCPSLPRRVRLGHAHAPLLFEGDRNAFFDPAGQYRLPPSAVLSSPDLLHHASEITAVTNQHVNSYKRLGRDEA